MITLSDLHPSRKRALIAFFGILVLISIFTIYQDDLYFTYLESYVAPEPASPIVGKISYRTFPSVPIECIKNEELEQLVHTNGTRTIVYVYYHNNNSHFVARKYAYCKDWIKPLFIPRSNYMESEVYRVHYLRLSRNWTQNYDFVLTCTYRHTLAEDKKVTPLTPQSLINMIQIAVSNSYDVIPLEVVPRSSLMTSLFRSHGRLAVNAYVTLLLKMHYSDANISQSQHILGFWRSSYLIRASTMHTLTRQMVRAMSIVDKDKEVKDLFERNAQYEGADPIVAYQVFGTPYYKMHPFIFERLPAFFLHMTASRVFLQDRSNISSVSFSEEQNETSSLVLLEKEQNDTFSLAMFREDQNQTSTAVMSRNDQNETAVTLNN